MRRGDLNLNLFKKLWKTDELTDRQTKQDTLTLTWVYFAHSKATLVTINLFLKPTSPKIIHYTDFMMGLLVLHPHPSNLGLPIYTFIWQLFFIHYLAALFIHLAGESLLRILFEMQVKWWMGREFFLAGWWRGKDSFGSMQMKGRILFLREKMMGHKIFGWKLTGKLKSVVYAPLNLTPCLGLGSLFYFYYSRVEMKNTNISAYFVHLLPQPWLIHWVFVCHKSVCLSLKSRRKRSPRELS